ncbi:MAG: hypothetical protein GF334_01965 [Candidatus Altiarchaeales archaeon]|nr:hypothetical protein [Candidatus Altiarchaeales archaeon]
MKKSKAALILLTGCGGCAILLSELAEKLEQGGWEVKVMPPLYVRLDLAIVAGYAKTRVQKTLLSKLKDTADKTIAFGACASRGAYNLQDKAPMEAEAYIDGCPPTINYAENLLEKILNNKNQTENQSVCLECAANQNLCLLKDGLTCLGPITKAGCNGLCTKNHKGCLGCMGVLNRSKAGKYLRLMGKKHGPRIRKQKEIYLGEGLL